MNFGQRFGQLVRKYREEKGLSSTELAEYALGDGAKRSRISELENGKVSRPHAKTIEALVLQLGIPKAEVDACRSMELKPEAADPTIVGALVDKIKTLEATIAAQASGVTDEAIIELARIVSSEIEEADEALAELQRAVAIAKDVQDRGNDASNLGPFVDRVIREMADLSAKGDFDGAAKRADQALAEWREEREQQKAAGVRLLEAALNQDILRRDPKSAAERIIEKCDIEKSDAQSLFDALRSPWEEQFDTGLRIGSGIELRLAIELGKKMQDLAKSVKEVGDTGNYLGLALQNQGIRAGGQEGTRLLAKAVTAYEAALEVYTRDAHPVNWAMTQMNLGTALAEQGTRAGGQEGLDLLAKAVTAYETALEVRTRDAHPVDWAMTQMNLANALQNQGTRAGGQEGTRLLAKAVTAYVAALEVYTRDDHPMQWAMTQGNLANALKAIGDLSDDKAQNYETALAHVNAALDIFTPEHLPQYHQMAIQNRDRIQAKLDALPKS